jgi:nitrous oxidase accessory protein NosD
VIRACGSPATGNQEHGIYVQNAAGVRIAGNRFEGASGYGVHLYPGAVDALVEANRVEDTGSGGIVIGSSDELTSRAVEVRGNAVRRTRGAAVRVVWDGAAGTGNVVTGNCLDDVVAPAQGVLATGNLIVPDDQPTRPGPLRCRPAG